MSKEVVKEPAMDLAIPREIPREIPILYQDIIEIIAEFCKDIATLLKLSIFFPYLVNRIKKLQIATDMPIQIPKFIDTIINFNDIEINDSNFEILKMSHSNILYYFKNIISIYSLDDWIEFIIDVEDGSNFHKTYSGKEITKYVISCFTNKDLKKISYKVLSYIVKYNLYNKKLDNIIFNRLSYYFKNTNKLKLSLLTNKEKEILLSNISSHSINKSSLIISALSIYSTKILDILVENYCHNLHLIDCSDISNFILSNPLDDYLLVMTFKYYFTLLKLNCEFYFSISYILTLAILQKKHYIIKMICDGKRNKLEIPKFIINPYYNDFHNKNDYENIKYLLLYSKTLDLSTLSWELPKPIIIHNQQSQSLLDKYILLFEKAKLDDKNLNHMDRHLLLKIYNYFHFYYKLNKLHITTLKEYPEVDCGESGESGESEESGEIENSLDTSIIKEHLFRLFNDLTNYFESVNKCKKIMTLSDIKCNLKSHIKYKQKNIKNKFIYICNIYKFILKYKLYYSLTLNKFITKTSHKLLDVLQPDVFTFNIKSEIKEKLIELILECLEFEKV